LAEPVLLSDAEVWLAGYELSGSLNAIELALAKSEKPNPRFGDVAEVFYWGLQSVRASVAGFWAAGVGEVDPVAWAQMDPSITAVDWPLFLSAPYAPTAAAGAQGNIGYLVTGKQFATKFGAVHGELLPFNLDTLPASTYRVSRQTIEAAKTSVGVTTTSVGKEYGALLATDQLLVSLHVFSINGGTWTLTIESDDNSGFTTPTVRDTFTAVTTAPTYQVRKILGAVTDNWWRAVMTETVAGTELTYAVTMGKETIA